MAYAQMHMPCTVQVQNDKFVSQRVDSTRGKKLFSKPSQRARCGTLIFQIYIFWILTNKTKNSSKLFLRSYIWSDWKSYQRGSQLSSWNFSNFYPLLAINRHILGDFPKNFNEFFWFNILIRLFYETRNRLLLNG